MLIITFIYCSWVSTWWQWSVDLCKIRKEAIIYTEGETIHKTIQKHRIHKMENKRAKQENTYKKYIKRHKSSNYKITKISR